jgi:hypothetical protein
MLRYTYVGNVNQNVKLVILFFVEVTDFVPNVVHSVQEVYLNKY